MVVMVGVAPVRLSGSVTVTVVAVPATVCVVKTTVAMPEPLVVLVALAKEPLALLFVQVTVLPAVATALPLASASCAVMVTLLPAVGAYPEDVTTYCVAAPVRAVMVLDVPVRPSVSVAVTVVAVPATVWV